MHCQKRKRKFVKYPYGSKNIKFLLGVGTIMAAAVILSIITAGK